MSFPETIIKHISDSSCIFVFPTNIAAQAWANWTIRNSQFTGVSAVSMERFLSWDSFKSLVLKNAITSKKELSKTHQQFINESLSANNEYSLINIEHVLPELQFLINTESEKTPDIYRKLYEEYKKILGTEYYIPSWEIEIFRNYLTNELTDKFIVFSPEILPEYQDLFLDKEYKNIKTVSIDYSRAESMIRGFEFDSSIQELRTITNFIVAKKKGGTDYSDMAISIPDYETYGAYVERELSLHDIPYQTRIEKPLSNYSAGKILQNIRDFNTHNFSMESIQNLLGNYSFPWKLEYKINIQKLIDFGMKNNCVYSINHETDIWEKTLEDRITAIRKEISTKPEAEYLSKKLLQTEALQTFYSEIKKDLTAFITESNSFKELHNLFIGFINKYFHFNEYSKDINIHQQVIRKIESLLKQLALSEKKGFAVNRSICVLDFAIRILNKTTFTPAVSGENVQIFEYKTACCAPYKIHIIVDASQKSLSQSEQYKKLKFIPEIQRKEILFKHYGADFDHNPTAAVIGIYSSISNEAWKNDKDENICIFTCAKKAWGKTGFLNCNIPNSNKDIPDYFGEIKDSYVQEKNLIINLATEHNYSKQIKGWKNSKEQYPQDYETDELAWKSAATEKINKKLKNDNGDYKFSVSMLKSFYNNPEKWLFEEVLGVKPLKDEPEIIDRFLNGQINHKILEIYLTKLQENNLTLEIGNSSDELPPRHQAKFEEALTETIKYYENDNTISHATKQLLKDKKDEYTIKFKKVICAISSEFNGMEVYGIEKKYENLKIKEEDNFCFNGDIDCILRKSEIINGRKDYKYVVIDYKTTGGAIPSRNKTVMYPDDTPDKIPEFQMPLYLKFMEIEDPVPINKIEKCTYFNIKDRTFYDFYDMDNQGKDRNPRKPYINEVIVTQDRCIELVKEAVVRFENCNFAMPEINNNYKHLIDDSYDQEFKRIKRYFFRVSGRED